MGFGDFLGVGFNDADYRRKIQSHPTDKLAYSIEKKRRQLTNNPAAYSSSYSGHGSRSADISRMKLQLLEDEWSARRLPPLLSSSFSGHYRPSVSSYIGNAATRVGSALTGGRSRSRRHSSRVSRSSRRSRRDRSVHFEDEPHHSHRGRSSSRRRSTSRYSRSSRPSSILRGSYGSSDYYTSSQPVIPTTATLGVPRTMSNHSRRSSHSRGRSLSRSHSYSGPSQAHLSIPFDYSYTSSARNSSRGGYDADYGRVGRPSSAYYPTTPYPSSSGGSVRRSRSRGRSGYEYQDPNYQGGYDYYQSNFTRGLTY